MEWWLEVLIIVGFFVLRLGVPLAITLIVGYWLRRLDARWQAEARLAAETSKAQEQVVSQVLEGRSQGLLVRSGRAGESSSICPKTGIFLQKNGETKPEDRIGQPCWVLKQCPLAVRNRCPAYQPPYRLCWIARRQAEGQVPAECYQCDLFGQGESGGRNQAFFKGIFD
jgi:hypothetical protein